MKYLLDTSWVIHYLRGKEKVVKKLLSLRTEGLAASIITLAELYEGVFRSINPILAEERGCP
jgi:Predicted nucleic acid-binding protein, contains PIN domain